MNSATKPILSVIIPTYKRNALLKRALDSLLKQQFPSQLYEIIIVFDGVPEKESKEIVQLYQSYAHDRMKFVRQRHAGPAQARNYGVSLSAGEILCFIDDDCIADERWLQALYHAHQQDAYAAFAGRVLFIEKKRMIPQYLSDRGFYTAADSYEQEPAFFITANVSMKRHVFLSLGGFDPQFITSGGEDRDFSCRLKAHTGRILFVPDAVVYHDVPNSLCRVIKTFFFYGQGDAVAAYKEKRYQILVCREAWWVFSAVISYPCKVLSLYRNKYGFKKSVLYPFFDCIKNTAFFIGRYIYMYKILKTDKGIKR